MGSRGATKLCNAIAERKKLAEYVIAPPSTNVMDRRKCITNPVCEFSRLARSSLQQLGHAFKDLLACCKDFLARNFPVERGASDKSKERIYLNARSIHSSLFGNNACRGHTRKRVQDSGGVIGTELI